MSPGVHSRYTKETVYVDRGENEVKSWRSNVFFVVCILCTAANLYVYNAVGEHKVMTFRDVTKLRRPNPFIGLDGMSNLAREPIRIYPILLSKINQAEPDQAYGDDSVRFAAWEDTVPPVDREFKVNHTVSTVVEFRTIDYRMEACELFLMSPKSSAMDINSTLRLGSGNNTIHVWRLNTSYPINMQTLSWNSRPYREHIIDTITILPGMNYSYHFQCPSDSLHAFEFSAADDSVDVEWSQDHRDPNPAVVVMQHATQGTSVPTPPSKPTRDRVGIRSYDVDPAGHTLPWFIPELEHVAMRIIPWSAYYELESEAWQRQLPTGGHVVHLANLDGTVGTHTVAVFHQLRCCDILRQAYLDEGSHRTSPLASHCMNYIRQTLLCHMDMRNEEQGSHPTNNGADTLCYDWEAIYEEAERNSKAYSHYLSQAQSTQV